MSATILAGSTLGLLVAALYAYIGIDQARRARTTGFAAIAFATFWLAIGFHAAIESGWAMWVVLGEPDLAIGVSVLLLKIGTGVLGIGGLVVYLLLVYGMPKRFLPRIFVAYSALYALMVYDYLSRVPLASETRTWYAGLRYQFPEGPLHNVVAVLLFLPPLLATVAYLFLLRHTEDPSQRSRIIATGSSLVVFFATFLLGWVHERWMWWGLIERSLAIGTSVCILWTLTDKGVRAEPTPQPS